jgi:hypothetical protein
MSVYFSDIFHLLSKTAPMALSATSGLRLKKNLIKQQAGP